MNNAQKQQQATDYTNSLNSIVLKIEQNELDANNNIEMTTPPYIVRQDIMLLRRHISMFITAELPSSSKVQQDAKPIFIDSTDGEYNIAGTPISKADAQTLTFLKWELEDVLKSTLERFNQHLINLRPRYYRHIPEAIKDL